MRRFTLLSVLFLSGQSCSEAQSLEPEYQRVLPGSEVLDPGRIRAHRVRYRKPGGSMIYDMRQVERHGESVWRLHVYFNVDEDGTPDEMFFGIEDLGFRGRRLVLPRYTIDVSFTDGRFHGSLTPAPDSDMNSVVYDKRYPHGGFEPAVMNYWITALPLAEGYTASIPVFDLNEGSRMFWSDIEVEGRETLEIDGRAYDTWRVRSRGIRDKTIWVSVTEPYAVKMITGGVRGAWVVEP